MTKPTHICQIKPVKPNLSSQIYQTKPSKPSLPNHTYETNSTKPNLQNQTYQTKPTKPNQNFQRNKSKVPKLNSWAKLANPNFNQSQTSLSLLKVIPEWRSLCWNGMDRSNPAGIREPFISTQRIITPFWNFNPVEMALNVPYMWYVMQRIFSNVISCILQRNIYSKCWPSQIDQQNI